MNLQGLIVIAIAVLAAGFLAWRAVGPFVRGRGPSGCLGCTTPCELKAVARRPRSTALAASDDLRVVGSPKGNRPD